MLTTRLLRLFGGLALACGYVFASVRSRMQRVLEVLLPHRNWRQVSVGEITLRVPPDWGEVELDPAGGLVIHNRPARFRTEGDAVWYGSAIELRIRHGKAGNALPLAPMAGVTRQIETRSGPVMLTLAVANGVGAGSRRTALRVLRSARSHSLFLVPSALAGKG